MTAYGEFRVAAVRSGPWNQLARDSTLGDVIAHRRTRNSIEPSGGLVARTRYHCFDGLVEGGQLVW